MTVGRLYGTRLNRARGQVIFTNHSELNIGTKDLAEGAIDLVPAEPDTDIIPELSSYGVSGRLRILYRVTIHVNRMGGLGQRFLDQAGQNTALGDMELYLDAENYKKRVLHDVALTQEPRESGRGTQGDWPIELAGWVERNDAII